MILRQRPPKLESNLYELGVVGIVEQDNQLPMLGDTLN